MGMGEPFDNFDNVIQSIRVLNEQRGLDIAMSHITVSTAGKVDGIKKFSKLNRSTLKLAISLNAPNDTLRSQLMPVNNKYPMDLLRKTLLDYPLGKSGAYLIEYILIKDFNDSHAHAVELAEFLKPLETKLNLIPLNPCTMTRTMSSETMIPLIPPSAEDVERFRGWLVDEKVFVRKRSIKGQGIMAACGQLGYKYSPDSEI